MLQFLEKKTACRRNRSEEMENEEIQSTEDERLKAMFIESSKRRNAICKVKISLASFLMLFHILSCFNCGSKGSLKLTIHQELL